MTKSLTEKWKDGELEDGYYYTNKVVYPETYPSCDEHIVESIDLYCFDYGFDDDEDICEVLAPVPSYEEYKELVRKTDELDYQIKAQKEVADKLNQEQKVKKLEQQLAEANEALKELVGFGVVTEKTKAEYEDPDDWECTCVADEYLDKWDIK